MPPFGQRTFLSAGGAAPPFALFVPRSISFPAARHLVSHAPVWQLLTALLENNPFMGMLNPDLYREKIRELEGYLKVNVPDEILKARDAALKEAEQNAEEAGEDAELGTGGDLADKERREIEAAALAAAIADAEAKREANEDLSEAEGEFLAKVRGLKFASSALSFIDVFEDANDAFQTMLMSSNPMANCWEKGCTRS